MKRNLIQLNNKGKAVLDLDKLIVVEMNEEYNQINYITEHNRYTFVYDNKDLMEKDMYRVLVYLNLK